jgi:lysozyme
MTNHWPHDNDAELDAFYGRPDGSAKWEVTNLTYIFPPWKAYLAGTTTELVHGVRIHKKVAASLETIFASLWETFGKSQAEIEKVDLHQIGGTYYFRARRGSHRLSNHARGIAIDIDPQDNQMGRGKPWDMDRRVVDAFEAEGWRWGKSFNDPMHYEAIWNGIPSKPMPKPLVLANPEIITPVKVIAVAVPVIKHWEEFRPSPYFDFGQWSNGYGQKCDKNAAPITEGQAAQNLNAYLLTLFNKIAPLIRGRITLNQYAAVLVFAYNVGADAFAGSTLLKRINSGDMPGAADQFGKWIKATVNGKKLILGGLVKRRADERALFLS